MLPNNKNAKPKRTLAKNNNQGTSPH